MSESQRSLDAWIAQRERFWAEIAEHYRPEMELQTTELEAANVRPTLRQRFDRWLWGPR